MDPLSNKLHNGEPVLFPNEEVYQQSNGITFSPVGSNDKYEDATLILTTHRLMFI
jgi:hypothetical protein